jgi:outer membrane receptor protein involved in Fe transport
MKSNNCLVRMAVLHALACALLAAPGKASADPARFDIAAQPLPTALKNFAAQAKMQLLYRYDIVSRKSASPVSGQLERHAALDLLLQGTGLEAVYSNDNTATIRLISADGKAAPGNKPGTGDKAAPAAAPPTSSTADAIPRDIRLAQATANRQTDQSATASNPLEPGAIQEIVVVGVKQALATSQQLKKGADTFLDSISATDLGAFPDQSASDALQRLPGITVNRLQSNDDSTHPSGEPTNILIRGLTQVRTEFNGRDTFSADSGRGLNFNDISPELLSRADAYKNQTADMIEGGIAGTVDLRTRLPFDRDGPSIVGSLQGNYGDRAKQLTPAYSVLASDTWTTEAGRFGLLLDYSRSHLITQTLFVRLRDGSACHRQSRRQYSLHLQPLWGYRLGFRSRRYPLFTGQLRPRSDRQYGGRSVRKQFPDGARHCAIHGFQLPQCLAGGRQPRNARGYLLRNARLRSAGLDDSGTGHRHRAAGLRFEWHAPIRNADATPRQLGRQQLAQPTGCHQYGFRRARPSLRQ